MVPIAFILSSSCSVMLSADMALEIEALERVSAVYSALLGTCQMS